MGKRIVIALGGNLPWAAPRPMGPRLIELLGGSEFRLRQGFAAQNACTRHSARGAAAQSLSIS